jgi:hypothetical protein
MFWERVTDLQVGIRYGFCFACLFACLVVGLTVSRKFCLCVFASEVP